MVTKITNGVIDSGALTTGLAGANLSVSILNAGNIRASSNTITTIDTNGNLAIDPNGSGVTNVTGNVNVAGNVNATQALVASAQPSATVSFTTNQTLTGATQYKLPLEFTNVSQGGMSVDLANARVTVPRSGRYLITGVFGFYTTATQNNDGLLLRPFKNNTSSIDAGIVLFSPLFLAAANYATAVPFTGIFSLAADDYIEFIIQGATAGNTFILTGAQWSIHLLS